MDGKGGQIMDLAMPIGAAVASSYGPSYARGAAIGSQLYQQSRARRDEMMAGDRLAETIMSLKGSDVDAQLAQTQQERARLIDTGWKPSQDGRLMRVNDLGETEFMQDPANTFNPQVNPLYRAAETLAASGKVNQAANFLSQASAQTEAQRRQALEIATQRDRDQAQRDFTIRMDQIEAERAAAENDKRWTREKELAQIQLDNQKELFGLQVAENMRQWKQNAPQRAAELDLLRAQVSNAESANNIVLLESLQGDIGEINDRLNGVYRLDVQHQKRLMEDVSYAGSQEAKDTANEIARLKDEYGTAQKTAFQKLGEIRERLGLPSAPLNEDPIGPEHLKDDGPKIPDIEAEERRKQTVASHRQAVENVLSPDARFSDIGYRGVPAGPTGGSLDTMGSMPSFTSIFGGEGLERIRLDDAVNEQ
jgi:hypothetical protein